MTLWEFVQITVAGYALVCLFTAWWLVKAT